MEDQAQSLRDLMKQKKAGAKVVVITSGKGGVGKSSLTVNMAIELSRRGNKVLIVDADFGLANIDVMLGVMTKYDLSHVIKENIDIREIIVSGQEGVQFISGGSGVYDLINLEPEQLARILENLFKLNDAADFILFDTGAGVNDNILKLVQASHETILVTTPEPTAIMDAYAMVKNINLLEEKPPIRLIINKAESEKEALAAMMGFIRIAKKYTDLEIDALGYILRDEGMVRAVKMQTPTLISFPKGVAAGNIERLMDRYLDVARQDTRRFSFSGFMDRLLGKKRASGGS